MSKLWIMSDLHLETLPYPDVFQPARPDFDVLVAAGDIFEGDCMGGFRALNDLAEGKPVVFVMGNHEHWNGVLNENMELAKAMALRFGITMVDNSAAVIGGCRFIGGTLWTDYALAGEPNPRAETGEQIDIEHDGGSHLITIGDSIRLHREARAKLEALLAEPASEPVVVVTHHAPHPECLPKGMLGTWRAGNCASDLSHLTDSGRAALWVHGHTHHCVDFKRPSGTRIVANTAGPHFRAPGFQEQLVIEVC